VDEAWATLAQFLATAERDMERFPGRRLADWEPFLHRLIEYRDPRAFDHLFAALRTAGCDSQRFGAAERSRPFAPAMPCRVSDGPPMSNPRKVMLLKNIELF
jgi:hypothetical protein